MKKQSPRGNAKKPAPKSTLSQNEELLVRRGFVNNARLAGALRKREIADARLQLIAAMCRTY